MLLCIATLAFPPQKYPAFPDAGGFAKLRVFHAGLGNKKNSPQYLKGPWSQRSSVQEPCSWSSAAEPQLISSAKKEENEQGLITAVNGFAERGACVARSGARRTRCRAGVSAGFILLGN